MQRKLWIIPAVVAVLALSARADHPAGFGAQWVRDNPFTLTAWVGRVEFDLQTYQNAGFNVLLNTTPSPVPSAEAASAAGVPWIMFIPNENTTESYLLNTLNDPDVDPPAGFVVRDEPSHNIMQAVRSKMDWAQQHYPSALTYSNALPSYATTSQLWGDSTNPAYTYSQYLDDFIDIIKPDVLSYDNYPFFGTTRLDSRYFSNLMIVRNKAQAANLPYWGYVQAFSLSSSGWRAPSESDMRMQAYSMLTAGYKGLEYYAWSFGGTASGTTLVDGNGTPTVLYGHAAGINDEVRKLGRVLRLLESTDVRFVPNSVTTAPPSGLTSFTPGAGGDPHIVDIQSLDTGPAKDGLVGFFTDDDGQHYFMLTNLYQDYDLTAAQAAVTFEITFDDSVDEVLRLNRLTGEEEILDLVDHRLVLLLPGGTGDLFKYNTGSFVPEPAAGVVVGLGALLLSRRRRR